MPPDLLIVCATDFEISHFLSLCPETACRELKSGSKIFSGHIGSKSYDLLISGPGVFNASQSLGACLALSTPSLIINTGIAGVFRQTGARLGDAAIAVREHYIHTGVQAADPAEHIPLPFDLVAGSTMSRQGIYEFDNQLVDKFHNRISGVLHENDVSVYKGRFITVSTITASFESADRIYRVHSPVMEAMEGAACAHVAASYQVPMLEIRCASNFVGERDKSKWETEPAVRHLGEILAAL